MEESEALTCSVTRVTRPNTLAIRLMVPALQSNCTTHLVLEGVTCKSDAVKDIVDWLEIHADFGRYELRVFNWLRDSFGRLMGNIIDRRTGETLSSYLIQRGSAKERPRHIEEVMIDLLQGQEPDEL